MKSVVTKGRSVNKAIKNGLALMNATKQDVEIEIIQYETKGVMGLGRKEAVVKLSYTKADSFRQKKMFFSEMQQKIDGMSNNSNRKVPTEVTGKNSPEDKKPDGKAWVKDGKIYVKDSPIQYPIIKLGKDIKLLKNNELVKKDTIIAGEYDSLEFLQEETVIETKWEVEVDKNKLTVHLSITPGYTLTHTLEDVEPDNQITLSTQTHKEVHNSLTYNDVISRLNELGVKHGFHEGEIVKAVEAIEPGRFEIAKGKESTAGKDGWLELLVETDTKNGLFEDEKGKVDFRESHTIPTVDPGRVLAVVHPPIPGTPGVTVTNEPLPSKRTKALIIREGNGIALVDDKIISTKAGRPMFEQRGLLVKASIMPKLVKKGDVNLTSGNIRFYGDVEVIGEVGESMTVETGGDLFIHKMVNKAVLTSSKSIITKSSVICAELSAGKSNLVTVELGQLLSQIQSQIKRMITVIHQLMNSSAFKSSEFSRNGIQPLIYILLERKMRDFLPVVKTYVHSVRSGASYLDEESWLEISHHLSKTFLSLSSEIIKADVLDYLVNEMEPLIEMSRTPVEPESYITIGTALNSRLYSSGDITIIGQSCITSKLHAGGKVDIKGILRGGEIFGRQGVIINEVGSESGTKTIIAVPHDQTITINKALKDTIIKIGNVKVDINDPTSNIHARLGKDGRVIL